MTAHPLRPTVLATYRLQLGPAFTFADAARIVPYLRDLGVSHVYLSPILQARAGSTHGYDVVDPTRVSSSLGGETALRALAAEGLPLLVDIVPNHMAASDENPFWRDPETRARFFDLDPHGGHRRFFDIDDLAGVRVEDADVFEVTHGKILELVRDGVIAAVRVDHIDGLADPAGYLERLRTAGVERVWVEKILEPGELLPPWPVAGTTGYEFLVDADALFVDPAGRAELDALAGFGPEQSERGFAALAAAAKAEQVATTFRPEVARLHRVAAPPGLESALASLPVYRTYLDAASRAASDADRHALAALPSTVADALLGHTRVPDEFVTRFQQTTGAVMAKGVEDTALYRHVRLLALNEVGGQPDRFGLASSDFHSANRRRLADWPDNLLAATTHDTKRNADTRTRIGALSALAPEWRAVVDTARAVIADHRAGDAPDATEEQFILQTLVGVWPISEDRLTAYLVKALREAKRNSSWIEPDLEWEAAVIQIANATVADARFLDVFLPFLDRVLDVAERATVAQVVLRCTSPGVPDIYQGDESWNLALVDPDNRRPVDFDQRARDLAALRRGAAPDRATAKLFTVATMLALRQRHDGFAAVSYAPIAAPPGICAFARGDDVIVAVPVRVDAQPGPPEAFGATGNWVDVLAPLDPVYGPRRPVVYEPASAV